MENTSACIRQLKEVGSSDSSKTMGGSSDSESCSVHSGSMIPEGPEGRTESGSSSVIEEQIEHSKSHWSQVVESDSDEEQVAEVSNVEVFKTLQKHPTWGTFFVTFDGGGLVVGKKFAEGGQAELYEAQVTWHNADKRERDLKRGSQYVLKVFKKGTFLRHLQSQWPQGLLQFHAERVERSKSATAETILRYHCDVLCGTLLKDGRFAFLLEKEQVDLRRFIERIMKLRAGNCSGRFPFSKEEAEWIMYRVAKGMDWLHSRDIVHRDMKASNVLLRRHKRNWRVNCFIADFECSIGVVGTGFFRAPEILQACKDRNLSERPKLFTKEADVYSYGMTCYEILTGKLPFEGHSANDYDLVLKGQRPVVPKYVDDWVHVLLSRCWQSNPAARPTFPEILNLLSTNSTEIRNYEEKRRRGQEKNTKRLSTNSTETRNYEEKRRRGQEKNTKRNFKVRMFCCGVNDKVRWKV